MLIPLHIYDKIERISGLDCSILGNATLSSLIKRRMEVSGLSSHEKYFNLLNENYSELEEFVKSLLVPETWFFRDTTPYLWFEKWAKEKQKEKIRILSAPCATGEEPYSIAICLLNQGWRPEQFQIVAIDLNHEFINKALIGIYSSNSFRGKLPSYFDNYFSLISPGQYRVKKNIRECVTFKQSNLVDPIFLASEDKFDFIFMRNVLIYFSANGRKTALKNVMRIIKAEGLLCLGHADNISNITDSFESFSESNSFIFKRRKQLISRQTNNHDVYKLKSYLLNKKPTNTGFNDLIHKKQIKSFNKIKGNVSNYTDRKKQNNTLKTAIQLAIIGDYNQAKKQCQKHLLKHPTDAQAYYTLGQVFTAESNFSDAEEHFRKALFLESNHYDSLFQLQLILKSSGRHEEASRIKKRLDKISKHST